MANLDTANPVTTGGPSEADAGAGEAPAGARLVNALEAGWPPASVQRHGPFTLREGKGGGQRVSATTAEAPFTGAELDAVIAQMRARPGPAVFQILPGAASQALDAALAARGWRVHDPVGLMVGPTAPVAALELPPVTSFVLWPPLAIQAEIWARGGIGPARLAVMARAAAPHSTILGRYENRPAGTAFVAVSGGIAGIHAVAVDPAFRRRGMARQMMIQAARWAGAQGAGWLALAVTGANAPARALYASLGLREVEQYHYRIPPEDHS